MSWWTSIASSICLPTFWTGFSAASASWKTIAIFEPRSLSSFFSCSPRICSPRNRTSPVIFAEVGKRPRMAIEVTLLPDPDSPTMPSVSL